MLFCRNFAKNLRRQAAPQQRASSLHLACIVLATEIKSYETLMDKMTPDDKSGLRHQAAKIYTEDQARLLLAMRDMVKWEVKRQLDELIKSTN